MYKNDKLFIKARDNFVLGYLRVGKKDLYLSDGVEISSGTETTCVLDFYIYIAVQRQGHGKSLFDKMCRFLQTQPGKLAYDSPSQSMLKFLYKHYSLINYIKQNNKFVVYKEFFNVSYLNLFLIRQLLLLKGRVNCSNKNIDYNYVLNHQYVGYSPENLRFQNSSLIKSGEKIIK